MIDLNTLNTLPGPDFAAALAGLIDHAPWLAERTAASRPVPTVAALHAALMQTLAEAPELDAVLAAQPAPAGDLAHTYRDSFGHPFILESVRHTQENIVRTLHARLTRDPAAERITALEELGHIAKRRLIDRVTGPGAPSTAGHLSTHVLDITCGLPAAGLAIILLEEGRIVAETSTDSDGRTAALLPAGPLRQGRYELRFDASAYFSAKGQDTLYDTIPIPFRITQSEARYHIPLLLAAFAYSTYRGS